MGLSIRAISKAVFVECDGNATPGDPEGEACEHEATVHDFPLGQEGLKPGCYVPGKGGCLFSFEIAYSDYARWFDELYRMLYGVDANGVYRNVRHYRGKPFVEFVDVPSSSDGPTIGPKMSSKLHADFVAFARKARAHFLKNTESEWMWDVYRDFRRALKVASDGGFVCYW
jgi:hypothetical protein